MSKSYRIRTTPGVDTNLKINIDQDFDTLDILSLKMTQTDTYTSLCADFGVVVGRVFTNGGYGIPNARVSIFIPIEDIDEDNPVISEIYPFKSSTSRNEEGYRYNLLPSIKQHSGHTPTGTFPTKIDVLTQDHVLEVYDKYYKYTAKTNGSGDFMLFGVPLGTHTIHFDLDLSDIGCQSMVPFDMVYQGTSEELFENAYTFMSSDNIDSLPQIISTQKTVNVEPFWGNPELCQIGITRSDFDLKERGVSIEPYSIFMGGTYTDSERNAVRVRCNVDNEMGEKCSLVSGKGDIECVRFSGEYEKIGNGINFRRPILESIQLNSEIDADGSFFVRVPMNLNYVTTDEFGYIVESKDPDVGIPTLGKYRFRLSLQDDSGGKKSFRGKYLAPQIKEHQTNDNGNVSSIDSKSYAFSTNIDDYPSTAIDDIIGMDNEDGHPNDYFYSLRYNRIYTISGFINQYYNKSSLEAIFSIFVRNRNESFLGIKEIQPEAQEDCNNNNQYFPITDAVANSKFKFLIVIILSFLELLYLRITQYVIDKVVEFIFDISDALYGVRIFRKRVLKGVANRVGEFGKKVQEATVRTLGLINYPDCYDCGNEGGGTGAGQTSQTGSFTIDTPDLDDLESVITNNEYESDLGGPFDFIESYSDSYEDADGVFVLGVFDENLYIPSTVTLNGDSNYIIKVDLGGINQNYLIGAGSEYSFDVNSGSATIIENIYTVIKDDILTINNLYGVSPDTLVPGSAHSTQGIVRVEKVYRYATATDVDDGPTVQAESGCDKYDVLYDHPGLTGGMELRAFIGPNDYDYYVNNPNAFTTEYPDVFLDDENPCDYVPPEFDIVSSISKAYVENANYEDRQRGRRLAKKIYGGGTASGYSEFRNGIYKIIPIAGKNQSLIGDYYRKKRLGKLLCSGYISYGFFNSWLNGSLYFFQFRKRGGGSGAKFCKDLIYRKEDETGVHYYYRSTPYFNGEFTGLKKSYVGGFGESSLRSQIEILSPTTIVDLGPRNTFINEICTDKELDVNCSISRSIGSTSYQDINDLMEYILMSKEVKEKGKLDAKDLFDNRFGNAIDGDIAQLLNYNSQAGIFGYEDESEDSPYWPENGVFVYDGIGPVGVDFVFSEDDKDTLDIVELNGALMRLCINGVGNLTETSQEVPYYKWDKKGEGFGDDGGNSEKQNWVKSEIFKTKYQGGWVEDGMLKSDPTPGNPDDEGQYYYDNDTTTELAYEAYTLPPIRDCGSENYNVSKIPLGGPFFFYFGLRTGKTSWNKFIDKFGPK